MLSYHMDYGIVTLTLSHMSRERESHDHHSHLILMASQTKTKRHQWRRTDRSGRAGGKATRQRHGLRREISSSLWHWTTDTSRLLA